MSDAADISRPKIIGASVKRTEDPRLLTGRGSFVDDRKAPDALHVAFRRSDHAHARIVSIDTAAARAMPGVIAVLTARDLDFVHPVVATSRMKGYYATPILPLAQDKVRYVGEAIVGVIAESRYLAEDALEAIEIDFEPLPHVGDPIEAANAGAPLLHDEAGTNVLVAREFTRGEPDAAFESAPIRVGRPLPHATQDAARDRAARGALPSTRPRRDALTLYSTTQIPGIVRDALSDALDLPGHRLRVVAPDVGGGFGGKASLYAEEIFVCAAARLLGRSVRWTSDRMEDLAATSQAFDEIDRRRTRRSTPTASCSRCAPTRSAMSAPIRSIRGPPGSNRCRW